MTDWIRRWCWGTWLVVLASVAWLGFVAAHLLLSGRAWWWTLPELLPPLAFLAVPAGLLALAPLARPARLQIVVVVLVTAALGWPAAGVNLAGLWHRPEPVPAGAVSVYAWNTFRWDWLTDGPTVDGARPRDREALYRHLREQSADVYLLSEYFDVAEDESRIRLSETDRLRQEFPGYEVATAGELITVSRFPIIEVAALDLHPYLDSEESLPAADPQLPDYHRVKTLRTDLRIKGRTVSFYNTHLWLPMVGLPVGGSDTRRDSRARYDLRQAGFRAIAADLAGNPHPAVLAGDFNHSPANRMLSMLPDHLVDPTAQLGSLYPISWDYYGLSLWRLDYLFTTPDVDVHRYRIVPAGSLSDHDGQHAVLSVPS